MSYSLNRRELLKVFGAAGATYLVGFQPRGFANTGTGTTEDFWPIADIKGSFTGQQFQGDNPGPAHKIFWDVEGYIRSKGGRPTSAKEVNVVVVGGGISGLLSAYRLRDLKPVVFEQDARFGGLSQGERFDGSAFAIGAAYIGAYEPGGDVDTLLKDLGLGDRARKVNDPTMVHLKSNSGKLLKFWEGETDPQAKDSFEKVAKKLEQIFNKSYPAIPPAPRDPLSRSELNKLDNLTAAAWLKAEIPSLHPHLHEYFQLYAWSSFGSSLEELSAAQFLNFISSDAEGVVAFTGGNAAIAQALCEKILKQVGTDALRAKTPVLEVRETTKGVEVLVVNKDGNLELYRAKAAVIAAPKYVASKILPDLPTDRKNLWQNIHYRAFVTAHVLLRDTVKSSPFDVFSLQGEVPQVSAFGRRTDRPIVDAVFAGWAEKHRQKSSVLSFYRPYPFDGARGTLLNEAAFDRVKKEMETAITQILPEMGLGKNAIAGLRLTRWGHALPVAEPGFVAKGWVEEIGHPIGRIFFANQDNYVNPSFEACLSSVKTAEPLLRQVIKKV